MATTFKLNTKGLDDLVRTLGNTANMKVQVGILESTDARTTQMQSKSGAFKTVDSSNATIGAAHEFGSSNLPCRSFLRIPLIDNLGKTLQKERVVNEKLVDQATKQRTIEPIIKAIGETAVAIVKQAFVDQGPGWAQHADSYTNATGTILHDTGQLKESITFQIKK